MTRPRAPGAPRGQALYTLDKANRALPLVRRIVDDLVACHAEWRERVGRFEYATSGSRAEAPDPDADRLQHEAQALAAQIEGFVRELNELGLECRALDAGVVDFPGELEGRPVYFSWRLGDASVSSASAYGTSISVPSRAQDTLGKTSFASRSRSDGSRE